MAELTRKRSGVLPVTAATALAMIRDARDFCADHGHYPEEITSAHEAFDDWAADLAAETIGERRGGEPFFRSPTPASGKRARRMRIEGTR